MVFLLVSIYALMDPQDKTGPLYLSRTLRTGVVRVAQLGKKKIKYNAIDCPTPAINQATIQPGRLEALTSQKEIAFFISTQLH